MTLSKVGWISGAPFRSSEKFTEPRAAWIHGYRQPVYCERVLRTSVGYIRRQPKIRLTPHQVPTVIIIID